MASRIILSFGKFLSAVVGLVPMKLGIILNAFSSQTIPVGIKLFSRITEKFT